MTTQDELKPGDYYVPGWGTFPADVYRVHDLSGKPDHLRVAHMGSGPMYELPITRIKADGYRKVDPATEPTTLRASRFGFDDQDYATAYPGFTQDFTWNGWSKPLFTREVADRIMAAMNGRYVEETDTYQFKSEADPKDEWAEPYEYKGTVINGQKLYPIGAGDWTWNEYEPPMSRKGLLATYTSGDVRIELHDEDGAGEVVDVQLTLQKLNTTTIEHVDVPRSCKTREDFESRWPEFIQQAINAVGWERFAQWDCTGLRDILVLQRQ